MKNFLRWIARTTLAAALVAGLASCGGGGVSSDTGNSQGTFAINPGTGSLYAGIPVSFQVVGGQRPYTITSNEQTVIPLVAFRVDGNSFSVIPRNPGVIDAGLQPGEVPRRTVILTVRDNRGVQITAEYRVLQNFLTGYSMAMLSLNPACNPDDTDEDNPPIAACSGFRSRLFLLPTTDGVIQRGKTLRISVLTGGFSMVVNENTGTLGQFVDVLTDEQGRATAQLHIPLTTPTQFATVRVTDVATGLYRDLPFTIASLNGPLAVLPEEITLEGPNDQTCGAGQVSVLVTGGTPPYTATSSSPQFITVTPPTVNEAGGTFLVNIAQAFVPACLQDAVVLFRDSTGTVATFTINTEPGADPPPTPLSASPTTVCVPDGGTASIAVIGGRPSKVINTSNPALATTSVTVGSNDFTFDILAQGAAPALGTFVTISVNDGTPNGVQIAAQRRPTCP